MSKKKNNRKNNRKNTYAPRNVQLMNTDSDVSMVEDMFGNECTPSVCTDVELKIPKKGINRIEYLLKNLPGINYVVDHLVSYIFSNGITTGSSVTDNELNKWLYRLNAQGTTNYEVLREVVKNAAIYGECGLRWYEDNLYAVKTGYYALLTLTEDGITRTVGYMLRKNGEQLTEDIKVNALATFSASESLEEVFARLRTQDILLLGEDEFTNIRNDIGFLHGQSPLLTDLQRIDLLINTYKQLNYDINNDGVGRLLLYMKQGYISGESEISTSEIIKQTPGAKDERFKRAVADAEYVGRQLKNSGINSVTVLSNAFSQADRLDRVTKATEFFDWMGNEIEIEAQLFGIPPVLVSAGHLYGNISMEKVIDNGMVNVIVPVRESYAIQFSPLICSHLGYEKVYFDKYELMQSEDENETRLKVSEVIRNLSQANKNSPSEGIARLITDLTSVMDKSLYDDSGKLQDM